MKETNLKKIASIYPEKLRNLLISTIKYNNFNKIPESIIALILFVSIAFSFIGGIFVILFSPEYEAIKYLVTIIILVPGTHLLIYTILNLNAEKRGKDIEDVLPDALHLISQSLRGGAPTHEALINSCKTEFKILNEELKHVSAEITLGIKLEDALESMTTRVKSEKLKYVVELMIFAIRSGGQLSDLLEDTAIDLRDQDLIELKTKAEVSKYKIMQIIALVVMVPFLYALVSIIINMFAGFEALDIGDATTMLAGLTLPSKAPITNEFFFKYSIIVIIIQMLVGSLLVGSISEGKATKGLKYAPVMIIVSILIYLLFKIGLSNLLGGIN